MFRPAIRPAREFAAEVREQADEFTAGPRDPDADAQPESRRGRRLLWWDGLVSNSSESFVLNFTGPFALALGATTGQIGWLSALVNLASALALFPGARLVERTGQRKRIVVLDERRRGAAAAAGDRAGSRVHPGHSGDLRVHRPGCAPGVLRPVGIPRVVIDAGGSGAGRHPRPLLRVAQHRPGRRGADCGAARRLVGRPARPAARLPGQLLSGGLDRLRRDGYLRPDPRPPPAASKSGDNREARGHTVDPAHPPPLCRIHRRGVPLEPLADGGGAVLLGLPGAGPGRHAPPRSVCWRRASA